MPEHADGGQNAVLRELDQIRGSIKDLDQKVESSGRSLEAKLDSAIRVDLLEIKIKVASLKPTSELEKMFVSKEEFEPVKRLVFGCVATILLVVVGAVLKLVVMH